MPDEILTVAEVAAELHCSKAHVYRLVRKEIPGVLPLPAIHLGRRLLVRRSTFEKWKKDAERVILKPVAEVDAIDA